MTGLFEKELGPEDALVLETETPGFSLAKLPTIPKGALSIGDTTIPRAFWDTCDLLGNGSENQVLAQSVDVSKLERHQQ